MIVTFAVVQKRILITGASGFVGSHLVEAALERGFETWAAVRRHSSRRYLTDPRLHFIELDLSSPLAVRSALADFKIRTGLFDYVVHAAGVTKARRREEFFEGNTEATRNLADALVEIGMLPRKFVLLSSLSIMGAIRQEPAEQTDGSCYAPILASDVPRPNTAYGESKLQAENYLRGLEGFPLVVLRPTGVYGPRDKDYLLMARSVARGIDFGVGLRRQEITFIYVKDLVEAVFLACERAEAGRVYLLSDGQTYSSQAFSLLLQRYMGVRRVLHPTAPLALLRVVCACGDVAARVGRLSALNSDKYHILSQRNWRCDITPARQELGYEPRYSLERGVAETVAWYRREGWI